MYPFVKRCTDIIGAGLGLIVLSPVLAIVAISIWIQMGTPILFIQKRPGLNGEPFKIIKFRTMIEQSDKNGKSLPDEMRLTTLGLFLRKTSLDELPELVNVLKGDMSLVGPRPLLMQYLDRYTPEQARRHEMKPGITGWAQVNGRNAINWEEKFALDLWYIDNWSLWLDIKILALTIVQVFRRQGINADGSVTMTEFLGYENVRAEREAAAGHETKH